MNENKNEEVYLDLLHSVGQSHEYYQQQDLVAAIDCLERSIRKCTTAAAEELCFHKGEENDYDGTHILEALTEAVSLLSILLLQVGAEHCAKAIKDRLSEFVESKNSLGDVYVKLKVSTIPQEVEDQVHDTQRKDAKLVYSKERLLEIRDVEIGKEKTDQRKSISKLYHICNEEFLQDERDILNLEADRNLH
mmetsp:Transcript_17562/g.21612  ORF Transcript_17562/g.21612 Transcript_17562/m.21612 type:complete len:192 (+) Transcript_17562:163-738(+)|eukprot:CAMPEP_0204834102 /NCGR_PEP_ID=MMETSP1346-20131115/18762_1 /ASSEMBLY_ACC=CAM_ASM_000771 /TAXON_ID=215587 /ORGANISM="Aplanochytrium stocchinoi, Strain GSBS06" /LENGTH=191 /DNA_ID=CAMNT_0051967139 /DNA_START=113 /DNA_END=688 /DNA_ORIENTATION=+